MVCVGIRLSALTDTYHSRTDPDRPKTCTGLKMSAMAAPQTAGSGLWSLSASTVGRSVPVPVPINSLEIRDCKKRNRLI